MRNFTRLLIIACGCAMLGPVTAAAQLPPPPTPRPVEQVTINFTPASARLSNIAKAKLDEVALMMKQDPDFRAAVTGYAQPSEGSAGGQALADARASAVKNYLVTRHGIDPARITTAGEVSSEKVREAVVSITALS